VDSTVRQGIDKVRLTGPVSSFPPYARLGNQGTFKALSDGSRGFSMMSENVYCEVFAGNNGMTGVMEATPAKVLGWPDNVHVPADDFLVPVVSLMRGIFEETLRVDFTCSTGDLNVNRLDLPIDMTIPEDLDLSGFIRGLGSHLPKYARKRAVYLGENGAQTLMTGSGARSGRVYDKEAESLSAPGSIGIVRFEPQLRKDALRREGIWGVDSILTDSLQRIRRDAFHHFGWDKVVCNSAGLGRAMNLRIGMGLLTERQAAMLSGRLVNGWGTLDPRTVRRYRALLSDIGLAVDLDGFRLADLSDEPMFVQANYVEGRIESLCV